MCLASCPIEFATRTHAIIARRTASGSAWPANPTETRIENATAAAGAMCVIDWKRTSGSPIECSRRRSKCWGGGAERASMFLLGCEAAIEARGRARVKGCLGTNRPCRGRSGGSRGLLARDRCLQRARLLDADCVTLLLREGDRLLERRGRLLAAAEQQEHLAEGRRGEGLEEEEVRLRDGRHRLAGELLGALGPCRARVHLRLHRLENALGVGVVRARGRLALGDGRLRVVQTPLRVERIGEDAGDRGKPGELADLLERLHPPAELLLGALGVAGVKLHPGRHLRER